jgi:RHS repeat-associated protein
MLQDRLGSVRSLVTSGAVDSLATYHPFREVESGGVNTVFKFTGEQMDKTDLVYLRARYMNPAMGGFVSLDPFEGLHQRRIFSLRYSLTSQG